MFLFSSSIRAHSTTIRGVQYNVLSRYGGEELIYDRIGSMIENSFNTANVVEITKPSLVDSGIALDSKQWYVGAVTNRFGKGVHI